MATVSEQKPFQKSTFVDYSLTPRELAAMKQWAKERTDVSDMMHKVIETGYKLTFSWDERNQCHCCWMIPAVPQNDNFGLILSGRGRNPVNALCQCLWCHFVKFKAAWPGKQANEKIPTWDDEA